MVTKQLLSRILNSRSSYGWLLGAAILISSSSLFAQVKIGSNPTTIEATSNLEVEASTGQRKVKVDKTTGQLSVKDGTEGTGKILTSDVVGGASWQTKSDLRVPETVWVGQLTTQYNITPFVLPHNQIKDRLPLIPTTSSLPGWDPSTKQYTIQTAGYYKFSIGATINGSVTGPLSNNYVRIYLWPSLALHQFDNFDVGTFPVLSLTWEAYMEAGSLVDFYIISHYNAGGTPQVAQVLNAYMSITKAF